MRAPAISQREIVLLCLGAYSPRPSPIRVPSVDLHAHSTASDGLLSPASLIRRAAANGVGLLALTDHDETGGVPEAAQMAADIGIRLVAGVEVSVTWRGTTVHIVGLDIDPGCETLQAGLASVREGRWGRATRIAADLARVGIRESLEGALRHASNAALIGRAHFARYLVECGLASEPRDVFKRYLAEGRPGYVRHEWASLESAVSWIRAAGGEAVIAHPIRYKITHRKLTDLVREFRELGGTGIEVVASHHRPDHSATLAGFCREFDLKASAGSDFHGPGEQYLDVGRLPALPRGLTPIWERWVATGCDAH
jgi:predicted metal-dependent phosphoesterase TrpH